MKITLWAAFVFGSIVMFSCGSSRPIKSEPPTVENVEVPKVAAYQTLDDHGHKMLVGQITPDLIKNETDFPWYAQTLSYYKPKEELVQQYKDKAGRFNIVLFAGTWCEDSHFIVPGYIKTMETAGVPADRLEFWATDREKHTLNDMHTKYGVTLVPTIIIFQDGSEVGRVVEYGESGLPDTDLLAIMKKVH